MSNAASRDPAPPQGYLITFRCYGTWLHGDERGSVDRHRNAYGSPYIPGNRGWQRINQRALEHPPVTLDATRRRAVRDAIVDVCSELEWKLFALSVRTNHVHSVVAAPCAPERVLSRLKAAATLRMRDVGCWPHEHSPWSKGGSKRYLWSERHVANAIDYVLNQQDGPPKGV
jgi:REP element-mobilizing transposase RayT